MSQDPVDDDLAYFRENKAPSNLPAFAGYAAKWIAKHTLAGRPIVLITSGGTSVPLEARMVRYVDNFSAGTRGAASAEEFIRRGYAVLFVHRDHSLLPYTRQYTQRNVLQFLRLNDDESNVTARDEYREKFVRMQKAYETARGQDLLLTHSFVTINDYLWNLKVLATLMQGSKVKALFYLAAAVSDFYVPTPKLAEHKIQSTDGFTEAAPDDAAARVDQGKLILQLDPVPKFLKSLVDGWAPQAMIVSFKLETNADLLVEKSEHALKKYAHHLVIGNLLSTRKSEVIFVSNKRPNRALRLGAGGGPGREGSRKIAVTITTSANGTEVYTGYNVPEIENLIVPQVIKIHKEHIAEGEPPKT